MVEGYYAFSPQSATHNDGLADDAHHVLNDLQDQSFWFRGRNKIIQEVIRSYFPDATNVLEIGCGSGYVLNGIRAVLPKAKLTGTEIFSYGLSYAANRVSGPIQFLQADARALPFSNEFDLIGAFDVLEHIEEHEKVIENLRMALKPNGGVILTVPQHPWLWSEADEAAHHKRRYTRKQLSSMLRDHGFTILLDTSFMFFLLPLMLMQRLFATKKETYSISKELTLPKIADKTFERFLSAERIAIHHGMRFPVGGSRLVVARSVV